MPSSNQPSNYSVTEIASEKMTPTEVRATMSLASIYGLRMFGMFSILPIFAIYASTLPDKPSSLMIGLALLKRYSSCRLVWPQINLAVNQ